MPVTRFHPYHGQNICLENDGQVANRTASFAHALTFSEKPLKPGEIFLIEIEENGRRNTGHVRIGLTQLNPDKKFDLPQYAIPDLEKMGKSWISAITKTYTQNSGNGSSEPYKSVLGDSEIIHTPQGSFDRSLLLPLKRLNSVNAHFQRDNILPTDIGSRIGIMYKIVDSFAELHFIINGEDQAHLVQTIPYQSGPLYAVIDVYGTTKKIRIIQLYGGGVSSLQNLCRDVILQRIDQSQVHCLPLPNKIKEFLRFECQL